MRVSCTTRMREDRGPRCRGSGLNVAPDLVCNSTVDDLVVPALETVQEYSPDVAHRLVCELSTWRLESDENLRILALRVCKWIACSMRTVLSSRMAAFGILSRWRNMAAVETVLCPRRCWFCLYASCAIEDSHPPVSGPRKMTECGRQCEHWEQ